MADQVKLTQMCTLAAPSPDFNSKGYVCYRTERAAPRVHIIFCTDFCPGHMKPIDEQKKETPHNACR
jgi:hypothetical protein